MAIAAPETVTLETLLESLLFVADGPVSLSRLAETLGVDAAAVTTALVGLDARLAGRGVRLMRSAAGFQLVSSPDAGPYVERFLGLGGSRLSTAALETLAIVAYRQPVTRAQIEAIRGVNVDRSLHTLLGKGLIEEVGRLETAGRPILFATTGEFLQYFGLSSLDDLPDIKSLDLSTNSR